jgi:hypothetical protein
MEKVAIGSCSDDLIRMWDLETGRVICSCSSLSKVKAMQAKANAVSHEMSQSQQLTCLCTNEKQDVLVGGYETGEVKVWLIYLPSVLSLKAAAAAMAAAAAGGAGEGGQGQAQHDGLTVPPLQLLAEWSAHATAIFTGLLLPTPPSSLLLTLSLSLSLSLPLSLTVAVWLCGCAVECISLKEEEWGTHETFLLTSGHDQESHLWTSTGLMVGSFGLSSWDLQSKTSWKMKPPTDSSSSGAGAGAGIGSGSGVTETMRVVANAVPPAPHTHSPKKINRQGQGQGQGLGGGQRQQRRRPFSASASVGGEAAAAAAAREDHMRAIRLHLHMEVTPPSPPPSLLSACPPDVFPVLSLSSPPVLLMSSLSSLSPLRLSS